MNEVAQPPPPSLLVSFWQKSFSYIHAVYTTALPCLYFVCFPFFEKRIHDNLCRWQRQTPCDHGRWMKPCYILWWSSSQLIWPPIELFNHFFRFLFSYQTDLTSLFFSECSSTTAWLWTSQPCHFLRRMKWVLPYLLIYTRALSCRKLDSFPCSF